MGENFTKAKFCARGFEELKDFYTDSVCCSKIGVWPIFVLIGSNKLKVQVIYVKTAFLQGKKIEGKVYLRLQKNLLPVRFGSFKNLSVD